MTEEIWKPIPNYPLYLVSNRGRMASIMSLQCSNVGRHVVQLTTGLVKGHKSRGRLPKKAVLVHRAVLEAFVGPPPTFKSVGRHLNDVPTDNRIENLAWGTKSDNARDAIKNGRWGINENSSKAKLSNKDVLAIRARYDFLPQDLANIAVDFGISISHACGIGKRKYWKHLPEDPASRDAYDFYRLSKLEESHGK